MKIRLLLTTLYLIVFGTTLFAQVKHDYNWMFGYGGIYEDPIFGLSQMNFNEEEIEIDKQEGLMDIYLSNATISDKNGNLLFYTNGCYIADKTHQTMLNGDSLNSGEVYDIRCTNDRGYSAGSQSCIILPASSNDSLYYLFHNHIIYQNEPHFEVITDALLCTTIDMSLNERKGAVISKNIPVTEKDSLSGGELNAVKHANGQDWWLMSPRKYGNEYVSFLFSDGLIIDTLVQRIGGNISNAGQGSGQTVFSPDGTKFARYNKVDGINLFNFDRSTGLLSNYKKIRYLDTLRTGGAAFSPNSRFLYISSSIELFQIDTEANNVSNSLVKVGQYDGFQAPFSTNFHQQQLGPDCRIYMSSTNGVNFLHVINHPDEKGLACDFQQHAVQLPTYHGISLPHFPNYRLGTSPTYPCDSTIVLPMMTTSTAEMIEEISPIVKCYPNPARDLLTVEIREPITAGKVYLYSALGEQVLIKDMGGSAFTTLEVKKLPSGIYYLKITENSQVINQQKVIITK